MTPKEKAKELYDKYEFVYIANYTSKHEVKQCALIAAETALEEAKAFDAYYIGETSYTLDLREDYWQQVIEEINNL